MKPPPFDYVAPDGLDEVVAILAAEGLDAKLLAGGQSLIPLLNFRLARPRLLVDLRRVTSLAGFRVEDGWLVIGAMTRQRAVEVPAVEAACPLLVEASRHVGHLPIRSRGTVGGTLAHGDPAAEYAVAALALDAEIVARGPGGERRIAASDFFVSYLTTALEPDEVLCEVRVPAAGPRLGTAFVELARRPGDFALASAAARLELDPEGRCSLVRIALGAVAPAPFRPLEAEALLAGALPEPARLREAARASAVAARPDDDLQASASYRRALCEVLVERALVRAVERVRDAGAPA